MDFFRVSSSLALDEVEIVYSTYGYGSIGVKTRQENLYFHKQLILKIIVNENKKQECNPDNAK
jgi:hypothetical protein